jgi:hypothetical protein
MTDDTNRVFQQALELEPDERALLAAELLNSLEESDDDVQRAWAAEIDQRSRHAAEERGEDWRVVLDRRHSRRRSLTLPITRNRRCGPNSAQTVS